MTLEETKRRLLMNLEHGVIGNADEADEAKLREMLAACESHADCDAWKRTVERWSLAPKPEFMTWDEFARLIEN